MERLANYAHLWYNSLGALQVDGCRIAHCYLVANFAHLCYNDRMSTNSSNGSSSSRTHYSDGDFAPVVKELIPCACSRCSKVDLVDTRYGVCDACLPITEDNAFLDTLRCNW